ncbi:MAG: Dam family site-specific DNA-(adenine-N6)-methyltransferase [Synergistaceae bacterium]|nr:Dam family site-specific DNA-(adenine-N6)-methyltransferase [Synergistaceae bacterium]
MNKNFIRSPFFYVGDKYKLMPQLSHLFPQYISTYIEPFVGGGSSFLNTNAENYIVNDVNYYVIELHKKISSYAGKSDELFETLFSVIKKYGLSCSYKNITVPNELKQKYIKTYYARYNKDAYSRLKDDFNNSNDFILLYILLIYGFNHMLRFNSYGVFNLPVGNVDFNKNVFIALNHYLEFMSHNNITFFNMDYLDFIDSLNIDKDAFVYFDPPYLVADSEYNKFWNIYDEYSLYNYLDLLNTKGVHFGITNLVQHKGKFNYIFYEWSKKYSFYTLNSNYISFNDNTIKKNSIEVYVTNYDKTK